MIRERISLIIKLYALIDLAVITLAFPIAYMLRSQLSSFLPLPALQNFADYSSLFLFLPPIWLTLLYLNNTYTSQRGKTFWPILWTVVKTNIEGVSLLSMLFLC